VLVSRKIYLSLFLFDLCMVQNAFADKVLTLGVVPQYDLAKIEATWNPLLKILKKSYGISFKLKHEKSIPAFEQALYKGSYDCAYMNPYHLLVANQKSDYVPVVKDSVKKLYGIVVVARNSYVNKVQQLDNKVVAFPAPNALGATLLVKAELSEKYKINVRPKYVKSHTSVYLNVILGGALAGGGVQKTFNQQPDRIKNKLKIIYTTQKVNAHPLACRMLLGQQTLEKIGNALIDLSVHRSDEKALKILPMKKIGHSSLNDYVELKMLLKDKNK